ncbi:hypothetical protein OPV22_030450 [Ensete ventricosum]|uniref:Uncharacterized protein n=1 Tax=Ensete ventricosum TaxID=4639 RepID=A0AAV8QE19_ENSVE|nr:hypothetical protein OPV22_030450 [Ensete ventricosum]
MAGKEVREYTNLSHPKGIAAGELLDTFSLQLLLPVFVIVRRDDCSPSNDSQIGNGGKAKTRSTTRTSPSSGWWLRCRKSPVNAEATFMGEALWNSDDLLYLKEQMEAEEDAERLLRRTEKRAFAAFKISSWERAASASLALPAPLPLPLRVEPNPKSGIRQQDLLKNVVGIKPKRHLEPWFFATRAFHPIFNWKSCVTYCSDGKLGKNNLSPSRPCEKQKSSCSVAAVVAEDAVQSFLGLAYESSDEE